MKKNIYLCGVETQMMSLNMTHPATPKRRCGNEEILKNTIITNQTKEKRKGASQSQMKIGNKIKQVIVEQNISMAELAKRMHWSRANVYKLLNRESIDTLKLYQISLALKHDFFADYSSLLEKCA